MPAMRSLLALIVVPLMLAACSAADGSFTDPNTGATPDTSAASTSVGTRRVFPADNPWNADISAQPVDPLSATLIASCGVRNLHPDFGSVYGIPYVLVGSGTPRRPVSFDYADESDPGPYPIPSDAPIEGGASSTGDRHVLVVDTAAWKLYELYDAHPLSGGTSWRAGSGAVFDLSSNALRPLYWTSADAAGLPIFPGLVRYDEAVVRGAIEHAVRFTCPRTRRAFIAPARHYASSDTSSALPPMGMRVRLKSTFDVGAYPSEVQVILRAMKKYGMILADNGSGWYVTGAPDPRWSDDRLGALKQVPSSAFEVVRMGAVTR
ncbi:MAG: hypothetical protein JWL95_3146 [Gemmatimonadetes bacterium]|nr:hypothetical protein [Gemmatimonadota bacterium]